MDKGTVARILLVQVLAAASSCQFRKAEMCLRDFTIRIVPALVLLIVDLLKWNWFMPWVEPTVLVVTPTLILLIEQQARVNHK